MGSLTALDINDCFGDVTPPTFPPVEADGELMGTLVSSSLLNVKEVHFSGALDLGGEELELLVPTGKNSSCPKE